VAVKYARGTILLVSQVPDQNGVNPKDRFVFLVRDFDDGDVNLYRWLSLGRSHVLRRPRLSRYPGTVRAAA